LIVGDIFKLKGDLVNASGDAQEIAKWFITHTMALCLLNQQQMNTHGKSHIYILPNITR
jgi:hypothetical protein